MELTDAVRACDDGLLERLDGLKLTDAPDGTPADKDLIADLRSECLHQRRQRGDGRRL